MMLKQRSVVGRTRVTPRSTRRAYRAVSEETRLAEAQRVARRFVAARWPELAGATPVATASPTSAPSPELLARLGLSRTDLAAPWSPGALTFTFAAEQPTSADTTTPLVANITVDARLRVVKASVSR